MAKRCWPHPYALKEWRYWRRRRRHYKKHPEVLAHMLWAHKHSKAHPDHQVWRDCNVAPRGGTACFTCDIWVVYNKGTVTETAM